MFRGGLQGWHILIIVAVVVLLFGSKRLPDAARSLGRSLRIIKAETKSLREDDVDAKAEAQATSRQPLPKDQAIEPEIVDPVHRVRDN